MSAQRKAKLSAVEVSIAAWIGPVACESRARPPVMRRAIGAAEFYTARFDLRLREPT